MMPKSAYRMCFANFGHCAINLSYKVKTSEYILYKQYAIRFTVLRRRYRQREKMSAIPMIEDVDFITPERQLIVRELKKKFDEAINALPPQCKLVYKMQREQGLAI